MGRPQLSPGQRKRKVTVWLTPETYRNIKKKSKENGQPLSREIEEALIFLLSNDKRYLEYELLRAKQYVNAIEHKIKNHNAEKEIMNLTLVGLKR